MGPPEDANRPLDPAVRRAVEDSYAQQGLLATLHARLTEVRPGRVSIVLPVRAEVSQHDGFVHAAAVTAILDSACGYAALTLGAVGSAVLTIEFKVNFLEPAMGEFIEATGTVIRPGRTTTCVGEAWAVDRSADRVRVALMQATMAVRRVPA
jgi:uncharacterized protein (TIGR00369 family)